MASTRKRIALAWWESVRSGWGTVGDFYAIGNVRRRLMQQGADVDVLWDLAWPEEGVETVSRQEAASRRYDTVAFVCGPLVQREEFQQLMDVFRDTRKVAVGVSVIAGNEQATALFDAVHARDRGRVATFDLALDPRGFSPPPAAPADPSGPVGLTLVSDQGEYGVGGTQAAAVADAFAALGLAHGCALVPIATQRPLTASALRGFSSEILGTRLILTNRLHGALMAILHGRPAIVIDQVVGGGKVTAVLERIAYPFLFPVDDLDAGRLEAAFVECQRPSMAGRLQDIARAAQALSRRAVNESVDVILA